jgi:hypothetical protein
MPQRDIVALHAIAFMLLLPSAKSLAICATVSIKLRWIKGYTLKLGLTMIDAFEAIHQRAALQGDTPCICRTDGCAYTACAGMSMLN